MRTSGRGEGHLWHCKHFLNTAATSPPRFASGLQRCSNVYSLVDPVAAWQVLLYLPPSTKFLSVELRRWHDSLYVKQLHEVDSLHTDLVFRNMKLVCILSTGAVGKLVHTNHLTRYCAYHEAKV